jgi:dipeptidase E
MTRTLAARRRVVLYSGGQERRNAQIHANLLELALRGRSRSDGTRMTYMPYTHGGALPFYRRFQRRYRAFGGSSFSCIAADDPSLIRSDAARTIRESDIIYLAGGNTFHFLAHLKRAGLLDELARFARRGGVVAGLSAGALILTPHIGLAGYPPFDRDDNEVGLSRQEWTGLGLVGFEFFPHFRNSKRYREALADYSVGSSRPVYACRDGSGVVVEGDRFTAHGDVWQFVDGHGTKLGG